MRKIGRYQILKKIGAGSQGTVFLCNDPKLHRRVAIKLVERALPGGDGGARVLQEAQTLGRFQHPNIVTVYDIGSDEGRPYIVFEFVEGQTLSERMRAGNLKLPEAMTLFSGLVAGVAHAHGAGVVHRDIKPANIIINRDGVAKLMDFGVAQVLGLHDSDGRLIGTPQYLAPEFIRERDVSPAMDVFALGAVWYEMLSGRPAFAAQDVSGVLRRILHGVEQPPSSCNPMVDKALNGLVLKALASDPEERFDDAGLLLAAVREYEAGRQGARRSEHSDVATIDFLLRRMQRNKDFPALSDSIRTINQLRVDSQKDAERLAAEIVKDFALTNKLLKVVNSAYYSNFAGKIGTVSRAIVVLGVEAIRSIAASLIFFDHLSDKATADRLRELMGAALFRALMAREVAARMGIQGGEECFVAAMFHRLGEVLVAYYLPEEDREIRRFIDEEGMSPVRAQQQALGMSCQEIGMAVARQWNFPDTISHAMRPLPEGRLEKAVNDQERLRQVTCFVDELTSELGHGGDMAEMKNLLQRFQRTVTMPEKQLEPLLRGTQREFRQLAVKLVKNSGQGGFIQQLMSGGDNAAAEVGGDGGGESTVGTIDLNADGGVASAESNGDLLDPDAVLTEGLQEATGLMVESGDLNQLIHVVLESLYRALRFRRVVLCLRRGNTDGYAARLGFGDDINEFLPAFVIPSIGRSNVFEVALAKGLDVYIANVQERKIEDDLPGWFAKVTNARSFAIFPVALKQRPVGFIYGEYAAAEGMKLEPKSFNLVKALRNQLVLGLMQR